MGPCLWASVACDRTETRAPRFPSASLLIEPINSMLPEAHPAAPSQPTTHMTKHQASQVLGDALLSRDDAAKVLGIAPLTLSRWVTRKKIRAYRIARRLCFSHGHLHEFLAQAEVGAGRR